MLSEENGEIAAVISLFEVMGPVMVGPSSSHTAGAARLGRIARQIGGPDFIRVEFFLHGSLAQTGYGHGTDKALLGGVMGMMVDDARLPDALGLAREQQLDFEFYKTDLGDVHPNSVMIKLHYEEGIYREITGASTGGGRILVTCIDQRHVEFTAQYPTLITFQQDRPGVVAGVTTVLAGRDINIAFLKLFRQNRGAEASMVIEMDQMLDNRLLEELQSVRGITRIMLVDAQMS